jgi:16S rRNA (uracil1498-N3)-methyltransferase
MHRLHVPRNEIDSEKIVVRDERAAYLRDVLRLRPGASVELFDGEGRVYPATLSGYTTDGAELEVGPAVERPFTGVRVTLAQGLPKGDKLELVIQKAVELGAQALVPLATERSIVKLDAKKAEERVARWQKIADEAARQCERADRLVIHPVQPLERFVATPPEPDEKRFILDEEEHHTRLRDVLTDAAAHHVFLIGPEGGLSRSEVEAARRSGYRPVTLGPRILRTETVPLAVLSVVQHRLGDFA